MFRRDVPIPERRRRASRARHRRRGHCAFDGALAWLNWRAPPPLRAELFLQPLQTFGDEANMPLYFFDSRDEDTFIQGGEGLVFPDAEAARDEATRALAELARDVLPGSLRRELAIDVRDEHKQPLLRTSLVFEAVKLR